MAVEPIIIDFQINDEQLITAQEQLAKAGKVDTKEFDALNKKLTTSSQNTSKLVQQFKTVSQAATAMGKSVKSAFDQGVADALAEAGVSADEFTDALKGADAPSKTLKQELKTLKEQLSLLKLEGKDNTAEFIRLRDRAGEVADAIADAGAEIKNAGSDTRNLDNVVGSISAIAGGFAAAQGAAALFGEENEDVQKALLKVNSAMAIAVGVQQFYNATLKEGSITKLADSVVTGTQTVVQKLYTLATGKATAATIAFKVALATTGIGLVVVAVLSLVSALNDQSESLEDVNRRIQQYNDSMESSLSLIDRQTQLTVARAKTAGKAETDLIKIQREGISRQIERIGQTMVLQQNERDSLKASSKKWFELNNAIEANIDKRSELRFQIELLNEQEKQALQDESKERIDKDQEANDKIRAAREKAAADARAARLSGLQDIAAEIERRLLFVEKGSAEELKLQQDLVNAKRDIELSAEKVTEEGARLIKAKAYKDRLDLQENFNKQATELELKSILDRNNAELEQLNISAQRKLELQTENIAISSQMEINAADGNATKILLIEAKKISDLRALRNAAIQNELADTLQANQFTQNIVIGALNKIAANQKESAATRIAAINGIRDQELVNIQKRIDANERLEQSDEDYKNNVQKLADERTQIEIDAAAKVDQVYIESAELRKQAILSTIQAALEISGQIADFFSNLNQLQSEQEQNRIAEQRRQLDALVEAGAITAKQAEARAKQIEQLERQAKQRQAQREKQEAVFRALLAIPQAYLTGLNSGPQGLILGPIFAAIAAAQAALVIARPVPKFFRGKRPGTHEGQGIVGDMGPELAIQGGRAVLYTSPTQTYLGRKDTVFTAAQTRQILHNTNIQATSSTGGSTQERFDYDRLAKAIPGAALNVNIDKDGITTWTKDQLGKQKTFDNRYRR